MRSCGQQACFSRRSSTGADRGERVYYQQRAQFGVELVCRTLGVSASAYYQRAAGAQSARSVEDEQLLGIIRQTHEDNFEAYGYRKMWQTLRRAGESAPRCQVQRLMRQHGCGRQAPWPAVAHHDPRSGRRAAS